MDKLKLAHEYVKTILSMNNACHTMDDAVNIGWQYADMMYAEQEKRTAVLDEFQVDWSQAPEWANWWATDGFCNQANWYRSKPYLDEDSGIEDEWNIELARCGESYLKAPSFNYQGDWKSSLQERK